MNYDFTEDDLRKLQVAAIEKDRLTEQLAISMGKKGFLKGFLFASGFYNLAILIISIF